MYGLSFETRENNQNRYARITKYEYNKKHSDANERIYEKEIIDQEDGDVFIDLATTIAKQLFITCEIEFHDFSMNYDTLQTLVEILYIKKGLTVVVSFLYTELNLTQKKFENFLCSLLLEKFTFVMTDGNELQVNDEILSCVNKYIGLCGPNERPFIPFQCLRITDNSLERWGTKQITNIDIYEIQTSFTLKGVVKLIKTAFEKNWSVRWDLGYILCKPEDNQYLMELQKTSGLMVKIRRGNYKGHKFCTTVLQTVHFKQLEEDLRNRSSIAFACIFQD